ncbi:BTAD domain-containing putative transcriptional regulator [Streptosporangium roseum]|uniref:ATPase-like protein n=1 Tax=Streptosporangium roseum (strain ATCC 12428 / DSM 43021 / JCM 3005 / KCTC 9067 / NCIMB 10171 / NRRL 2505 / NI 9100) TaxID=479432 RepID=D2B775_STRRD|nr:BTAD domain-containing putative transcriptional regulator [Streptosporangium roseum]ACZ89600.1 ATPase-like protein [Streptosporangium roseum DSM 43021]
MRFGVLGPLAVWTTDGRPVRVPELKVRALLADLLVHQGRPVPADRLADDLWGEDLPGNPANTLQTKVSQLRRALEQAEPGGRGLVAYLPAGYLLRIEADAVDARRFADLVVRARESGDPRARAALLSDALALWRGPAFADFGDEGFTRAAITRLEEQRLTVLEEQAEVRLELGEHGLLADELGDLVARHPLRERLRAAHVRALYRAGRRKEALDSYGELREQLAEELGLDPGPELTALHQAILEQDPALSAIPAPATSAARPRTNLPAPLTDLIGRDGAVAQLRALLESARLVTLTGPGGVGKTRLALETAAQLTGAFPDGVWLVELAGRRPAGGPDTRPAPAEVGETAEVGAVAETVAAVREVAETVAAVLGIRDGTTAGSRPGVRPAGLTDRLADALRPQRLLLVLDNCEHVVEPVAELAELLLRRAPGLRILATSQEPLAVSGEVLQAVAPLEFPGPAAGTELSDLRRSSAVRLFVARASAAAPGFVLDADNAPAVAAICRRLDGLPLALELAATRIRALGARGLAERLDDRFRLLATGKRGAPARQQTLRAMIDWSWELLTEPERVVLRRLAVHSDGCTLEAAEAVCPGEDLDTADVLDLLIRLVDRSLVATVNGTDGPRYRLLESVAAYCLERLHAAGETDRVRRRHDVYYTELAERAEPHLYGPGQRLWLQRLDAETSDVRSALQGAARRGEADLALRLVNAAAWYWFLRGRHREGHRLLTTALAVDGPVSAAALARATTWQAGFAMLAGDGTDLVRQSRTALKTYDGVDDPEHHARAEWFLGLAHLHFGDVSTGGDLAGRALARFRALDDRWGVAAALGSQARQAMFRGDFPAAGRSGSESAALFGELGDRWGRLQATDTLGYLAEVTGDHGRAARLHRDGLRVAEELQLWTDVSYRLSGLGRIALLTGDFAQAGELHERAMRLAAEQSNKFAEEFAEVGLGLGARRQGELETAETHLRNSLDWNRRLEADYGVPFYGVTLLLAELGFIAEQRGDAGQARSLHLEGLAAAREIGDPRAIALALEGLAGAQALAGDHGHAARLLGTATAVRASVGAPLPPAERGDVDRITSRARDALGEEAFAARFAEGTGLDHDAHLRYLTPPGPSALDPVPPRVLSV